uniref:BESS domain-containing protein n=2 Tax=Photinus pyralis TaxID=7054 RepID=A0A1Y1KYN6_PHOPY
MNVSQSNTQELNIQESDTLRTTLSSPIRDLTRKRPMNDSTTNVPTTSHGSMNRSATPSIPRKAKQKASNSKDTVPQYVTSAIQSLQDLKRSTERTEDEFFHFGNNVASQLRQLPLDLALHCQSEIMALLANQRVTSLQRSQSFVNRSQFHSGHAETPIPRYSSETNSTDSGGQYQFSDRNYQHSQEPDTITAAIRSIGGFDALN